MKKITLILFTALVVTSCMASGGFLNTGTRIPEPESDGAMLYRKKCSGCHSLPHPARHTYSQWEHMMALMKERMEERGVSPLKEEEEKIILNYLKAHGRGARR